MPRRLVLILATAALALPGAALAATATRSFTGTSTQSYDMTLRATATAVTRFSLPYDARCGDGVTERRTLAFKGRIPLASGRFVNLYKGDAKAKTTTYHYDQRTEGIVGKRTAKGTHRTKITITDRRGKVVTRCDTKTVRWELRRR